MPSVAWDVGKGKTGKMGMKDGMEYIGRGDEWLNSKTVYSSI